ncbi:hypothetical protein ACWE42_08595 [Sutcliffiella cohnii]|uniref:hypothetical protein n=1 Tax=Sutcliffiella TaxID=2837511 RepID=UPI0022DD55A1|nr:MULTISPECIES: hypothetical protein [Sutcliffiella]MED4015621.1 hypothetical protein [Sutcliffiella cohnii]WBL15808.1 hypothetical protein O1A01_03910 [Sutcliffiella sp. NC1]
MSIQNKDYPLTKNEYWFYLIGSIVLASCMLFTFMLSSFYSPLILLQIRLLMIGIGIIFYLTVYIFYKLKIKVTQEELKEEINEIIIIINGKEIGRV